MSLTIDQVDKIYQLKNAIKNARYGGEVATRTLLIEIAEVLLFVLENASVEG